MATRYYLRRTVTATSTNLPSAEQSLLTSSGFGATGTYGISGNLPPFRDLKDVPGNQVSLNEAGTEFMHSSVITSGSWWGGWWRTFAFATGSVIPTGTLSVYYTQGVFLASTFSITGSQRQQMLTGTFPHVHVYQWRPGVGKITSFVDAAFDSHVPSEVTPNGAGSYALSRSLPCGGATLLAGDMIIYETWMTSSYPGPADPAGGNEVYYMSYGGRSSGSAVDGALVTGSADNAPQGWIEFSENLPTSFLPPNTASIPSLVYVKSVTEHQDSNKLRVEFSAPISADSVDYSNYILDPYIPVKYAVFAQGGGNTIVDLHFGEDMALESNTYALWSFNEAGGYQCFDQGPNAFTLSASTSLTPVRADGLMGRCRQYNGLTSKATGSATLVPRNLFLSGNFSVEAIVRLQTGSRPGGEIIVSYAGTSNNTLAENYLFAMYISEFAGTTVVSSDPAVYWESGLGTDHLFETRGEIPVNRMAKVDCVIIQSGSSRSVRQFINGRLDRVYASASVPAGGTSANMRWMVGASTGLFGANFFSGLIDSIRITSGTKTDEQIYSASQYTIFPITRGQKYVLSASNVFDASGRPLMEPSSSYVFQYLGSNAIPSTSSLEVDRVFGSSSYSIVDGGINSGAAGLDLYVQYEVPCDCVISYTPPVIGNFSPAAGSNITRLQPIGFDVTDDGPFRRIILLARYVSTGLTEAIHDGDDFGLKYQGGTNVRTSIGGGYTYTILRDGGWPESPIISPYAIDVSGSENL